MSAKQPSKTSKGSPIVEARALVAEITETKRRLVE